MVGQSLRGLDAFLIEETEEKNEEMKT